MHFRKTELDPAIIWKLLTGQWITSKKYLTLMGQYLSLWYGNVTLVIGYPVLTAFNNLSQHGYVISGCTWAPKLARKCEARKFLRGIDFLSYGAPLLPKKSPQTNLMTGDLFPSFRSWSVASLMLEPLMNICWRQIFAILFCLKKKNWRLSKASTS